METLEASTLMSGLRFPEGLRWYAGRLWFSDIAARRVVTVTPDGVSETIAQFEDDEPSGLGFLADGTLLVAMRWMRQLRAVRPGERPVGYADLSDLPGNRINDMVVDGHGRAYVNLNVRGDVGEIPGADFGESIVLVDEHRRCRVVDQGDLIPNGMVVTPDGSTLISADNSKRRLLAWSIEDDGSLADRRVYAECGERNPDGIALDAEVGVWFASANTHEAVRVLPGGAVTHRISVGKRHCVCVALGGKGRKTIFLATLEAESHADFYIDGRSQGRIEVASADVPGVGWP